MAQSKFTTSPTPSNIVSAVNAMVDDIASKAASSHNHSASDITSGALTVANGGTGATTADVARSNLGINSSIGINPVGTIIAYAANGDIPKGYLPCNGAAVSRATYAALFEVIGTLYGEGDGSTTFNLPDLTDRFLEGSSTAGNVLSAGLPNILGGSDSRLSNYENNYFWGAFRSTTTRLDNYSFQAVTSSEYSLYSLSFNASDSNTIYGNSTTVQPPALTTNYVIKY